MRTGSRALSAGLLAGWLVGTAALPAPAAERLSRDQRWNRFAEQVYALHQKIVAAHDVREVRRVGGYYRRPEFYEEVRYLDAASGRLLSLIQWERERLEGLWGSVLSLFRGPRPQREFRHIHSIAVNLYDEQGRVIRDYSATYLPDYHKVPTQTLIFLHAYPGGLHAWRGFDASGNRLYEGCRGELEGQTLDLSLDGDDIARALDEAGGPMETAAYRACFGTLPESAGPYLDPR